MRAINILTLILVIVGGINWLLVGVWQTDLVAYIFGTGTTASMVVYVLVGLSAVWQLIPLTKAMSSGEVRAQRMY